MKHEILSDSFKNKKGLFGSMNKKEKRNYFIFGIVVIVLVIGLIFGFSGGNKDNIKIGIITDLTGPAAYWGVSSQAGADLAIKELNKEGYDIELIYEDYKLDSSEALSSAQKLVNVNDVEGVYAEFNPAAISVGSFLKGKEVLYLYDAAIISPLEENSYAYKTYLDYKEGCRQISENFREEGIENIGVLKVNLEFGEICLEGVEEVYGENTFVESYNLGDQDFKTQILKLNQNEVGAVINVGFEGDTLNTLKVLKEQDLNIKYGTVDDTLTERVLEEYSSELEGAWSFGFPKVSQEFKDKIEEDITTYYGAAITYTHIKQMGKVLSECGENMDCVVERMDNAEADNTIGFREFANHIADLDMQIKNY